MAASPMGRTFEEAAQELGPWWPQPRTDSTPAPDALECWSVTTILKALYSYGLEYWKLDQVAKTAFARRDALAHLTEPETVQLLTRQDNWTPSGHELTDRDLGREVHRALENVVLGLSDRYVAHVEAAPFVASFLRWVDKFRPRFMAAEMTVYDPLYLYAGTADTVAEMPDGRVWLLDYKTTRNDRDKQGRIRMPYPEWALQLAAYRYAPYAVPFRVSVPDSPDWSPRRYYFSPDDVARAVPMVQVDACGVLQITKDTARLWPARIGEDARDAFLYLREVSRYVDVTSRRGVWGSAVEV